MVNRKDIQAAVKASFIFHNYPPDRIILIKLKMTHVREPLLNAREEPIRLGTSYRMYEKNYI